MIKKNFNIFKIVFVITIIVSFLLGFFFHQKKFFPYYYIQYYKNEFVNNFKVDKENKDINKINKRNIILKKKYSLENLLINEKTFNTHTLPLKIKTFDLSKIETKKFVKGGLCSINKKLLFFYNNNLYFLNQNNLHRLSTTFLSEEKFVTSLECFKEEDGIISFFFNVVEKRKKKSSNQIIEGKLNIISKKIDINLLLNIDTETHNGAGKILILDSENLFLSFSAPDIDKYVAQDLEDIRGKIVLINIKSKNYKVYSSGHRNPQGIILDNYNNFFATEHGPYGGDELNLILHNKNYGWPLTSDGLESRDTYKKTYGELGRHSPDFEKPIFSWTPGIGISDLLSVNTFDQSWKQDLLIGSLKNRTLYRIRLDKINNKFTVKYVENIWIGHRIRHIEESINKKIYLITDDDYLIEISKINKGNDKWVDIRPNVCLSCHHLGVTNQTHTAPTLVGIFNKLAGSDPDYKYSKAFKNINFKWDKNTMIEYLTDPQKFLPGTIKQSKSLNFSEASKLVEDLEKISITLK